MILNKCHFTSTAVLCVCRFNVLHCFIVGLSLGAAQRTGVSPTDHSTVDGIFWSERTVTREISSPVADACLRPTAISVQASDETAVQPQLIKGKPQSDVSGSRAGRQATRTVETALSLDPSHSVTPAVFTGSSHDHPSHQSHIQCPVKLNGVSNTDKSADTCSGICC